MFKPSRFIILLLFFVFFPPTLVQANHNDKTHRVHVRGEVSHFISVICNTREQMLAIANAHEAQGQKAGVEVFKRFNKTHDQKGNLQCGFDDFRAIILEKIAIYKNLKWTISAGVKRTITFYIYKVRIGNTEYYTWGQWPLEESAGGA